MPQERYRIRSGALDTIAKKARQTGDPVVAEALGDIRKAIIAANKNATATPSGGRSLAMGGGAAGVKEVLDWLWGVGLKYDYPILYEGLHLGPVDAGIMAIIAGFFVWVGRK